MYIKHSEDTNLPEWLSSNLRSDCDCGHPIENYYNEDGRCTGRRCSNTKCYHMVARKIVALATILKVEGVGPATAEKWAKSYDMDDHFDVFKHNLLPVAEADMATFMRMCFIEGVDKSWENEVLRYPNITAFLGDYNGKYSDLVKEYNSVILNGLNYINVKDAIKQKYEPVLSGFVMMTGNINMPVRNRESLLAYLNLRYEGLVRLKPCGNRKTGVLALIKEENTSAHGKLQTAKEEGIPVFTSHEFVEWVGKEVERRLKSNENDNEGIR